MVMFLFTVRMFLFFPVCVYKGSSYSQGQHWQDGCNYNCECDDAM